MTLPRITPVLARALTGLLLVTGSFSCGGGGDGGGGGGGTGPDPSTVTVDSLRPDTATAGRTGFQVTVYGDHFASGGQVLVNGAARPTSFNSPTRVFFTLSDTDLTSEGPLDIQVTAPGATTSEVTGFQVLPPPPVPVFTAMSVDTVPADSGFTIQVTGQHIRLGSRVLWDGQPLTSPGYVDSTTVRGVVPPNLVTHGTHQVAILTYPPGGGTSAAASVVARAGVPEITYLFPDTATAGRADLMLDVGGTQLHATSMIRINGVAQSTTFNPATRRLHATVAPAAIPVPGPVQVSVLTPAPGGGSSAPVVLTLKPQPPLPTLTSLSVDTVLVGISAQVVATGTGFVPGTFLQIDGSGRATLVLSDTQATADLSSFIVGTHQITAFTRAPGGGQSNALPLVVRAPNAVPQVTGFMPAIGTVSAAPSTLAILGHGFVPQTSVAFNRTPRSVTYVDSTQLQVSLLPGDLATIGYFDIDLDSPAPGGGTAHAAYPVADPRASDWTIIPTLVTDLAWDDGRQQLYASIPATNEDPQGRIVTVDLATGALTTKLTLLNTPLALRLSSDGNTLVTAMVDARTMLTVDLGTFTPGGFPVDTLVTPFDFSFDASPTTSGVVAVTTSSRIQQGLSHVISLWAGGQRGPNETPPLDGPIAFNSDGGSFFAVQSNDTTLVQVAAADSLVGTVDVFPGLGVQSAERWMRVHGGRLYTNRGRVIDLNTMSRMPDLALPDRTVISVALDPGTQRLYTLSLVTAPNVSAYCALGKYHLGTLQFLDEVLLPITCAAGPVPGAAAFVRTGPGALAFPTADITQPGLLITLLRTSLVD